MWRLNKQGLIVRGPGCQAKDLDWILEGVERSARREWSTLPAHSSFLASPPPRAEPGEGQVGRPLEAAGITQQRRHGAGG